MSVSGFFTSIADKAQNAINQTPLAGRIPGTTVPGHAPDQAPSQGHHRSFALESLQHQIRNLGQQYTSTNPIQRIITLEKGVALDLDALSRDGQAQSKELYLWGQNEEPDLTDVTDRLAFFNYVHGSLSASLAVKLDNTRSSLKALRDAEVAIAPKRNNRAALRNQIGRLEHNPEKGSEPRLAELREQLARVERNDEHLEKEIELLKRKAIRESEQRKWEAIQEYAEKLVLVAQATKPVIGALPTLPPTTERPYTGAEVTAAAKGSLQHALDNYKLEHMNLSLQTGADLARSDTRSFGESHASELSVSGIQDLHPGLSVTPPILEPTLIEKEKEMSSANPQATTIHAPPVSGVTTVISSLASGPGTDSSFGGRAGSSSEDLYTTSPAKTETAEEEKKRLEREERERVQAASNERRSQAETAEEEKQRLEKEERERVAANGANAIREEKDGDELPPYQDIQE